MRNLSWFRVFKRGRSKSARLRCTETVSTHVPPFEESMRKIAFLAVTALVLSFAAAAYAAQVNQYTLTASTSPKAKGTTKKPKPIGINFNFSVAEASNNRPGVVEKYVIKFGGTRVNTSAAPACKQSVLNAQGPSGCPSKSIVGTGFIENETGATNNEADKSIQCNAQLSVVNLGSGNGSIYVQGDPNQSDPRRKCAIELAAGIPAKFRNTNTGSELSFVVPESLKHPGSPAISNAVKRTQSKIKKITKNGKGFYEAIGGCNKQNKRTVTVTFRTEAGDTDRVSKLISCS
jgi:hypothetical protein